MPENTSRHVAEVQTQGSTGTNTVTVLSVLDGVNVLALMRGPIQVNNAVIN